MNKQCKWILTLGRGPSLAGDGRIRLPNFDRSPSSPSAQRTGKKTLVQGSNRRPRFLAGGNRRRAEDASEMGGNSSQCGGLVGCLRRTVHRSLSQALQSIGRSVGRSFGPPVPQAFGASDSVGLSVLQSFGSVSPFSASVIRCVSASVRQSGLQLATCHWINTFTSTLHLSCGSFICAVPADPCLLLWSVLQKTGPLFIITTQCCANAKHHLPLSFLHNLRSMTVPIQPIRVRQSHGRCTFVCAL